MAQRTNPYRKAVGALILSIAVGGIAERCLAEDCNGNGVEDAQDIATGTSEDCNTNGVPDECDIAVIFGSSETKVTSSGGDGFDSFGWSASISGDTAVVGAPWDDDVGTDGGSAYLFVRTGGGWTEGPKLTAFDGAPFDAFGYSVSVSGDTVVAGAPFDADAGAESGSAYVFVRGAIAFPWSGLAGTNMRGQRVPPSPLHPTWTLQAKLTASDAAAGDWFGYSVSVSGDTAVVGAFIDANSGTEPGSAYVFVRSSGVWTQQAKLAASDAAAGDHFGRSVSVSGETAVVGALGDDDAGAGSGSAYVFVRSSGVWTEQAKLAAADAAAGDHFGRAVSVSGNTVVVAATGDADAGTNSGSAYVFVHSGGAWTQQAKLTASDAAATDWFGWSISASGDTVVVGALGDSDAGPDSGAAYVFVRSGEVWTEQAKLAASDANANRRFGRSASVSRNTALVGAGSAGFPGSAYFYELETPDSDGDGILDECEPVLGIDAKPGL